ncbi:hypothetical protein [Kineococcus radiotolerans]|uniref:hypothetical protein n=1 Tax=Kineococcus radiotolerans TaxID=131568 RepID=UPI00003A4305|nr:hypothetical protein [Kineococcus radiotolerans]
MPRPAPAPSPSRGWVLVPASEPGLLHRARHVVRRSRDLVLVALDPGATAPAHACLGVGVEFARSAPRPGRLVWLRDLTATETAAALEWIGGPLAGLGDPPAALRHRVAATQPAGVHSRAGGQPRA